MGTKIEWDLIVQVPDVLADDDDSTRSILSGQVKLETGVILESLRITFLNRRAEGKRNAIQLSYERISAIRNARKRLNAMKPNSSIFAFNYFATQQQRLNREVSSNVITYIWEIDEDVEHSFIDPITHLVMRPKPFVLSFSDHQNPGIIDAYYLTFFMLVAKRQDEVTPYKKLSGGEDAAYAQVSLNGKAVNTPG